MINFSNFFFIASIFILSFISSGCLPTYQLPAGTNAVAKIDFNNELHFGKGAGAGVYTDPLTCTKLNVIKTQSFTHKLTVVPANKLLTIKVFYTEVLTQFSYNACTFIASFIPKEGRQYRTEISEDTEINGKRSCDLMIYDVTDNKNLTNYVIRERAASSALIADLPDKCNDTNQFLKKLK